MRRLLNWFGLSSRSVPQQTWQAEFTVTIGTSGDVTICYFRTFPKSVPPSDILKVLRKELQDSMSPDTSHTLTGVRLTSCDYHVCPAMRMNI